ncbi:MAG TPA: gamma-glutamylcyclotransferase family protein [Polyangiaceae bacterium]|nr:gamma-glutamylcyclotransferase family protein [Polyangiaceae bacterium]
MVSAAAGPKLHFLFVYGSLGRGRANHDQLASAAYVSLARTAPCFALRIVDGYPALVPGSRAIEGELFRIGSSALGALDEFEGPAYVRREIELEFGQRALAYLSRVPGAGEAYSGDRWEPEEK